MRPGDTGAGEQLDAVAAAAAAGIFHLRLIREGRQGRGGTRRAPDSRHVAAQQRWGPILKEVSPAVHSVWSSPPPPHESRSTLCMSVSGHWLPTRLVLTVQSQCWGVCIKTTRPRGLICRSDQQGQRMMAKVEAAAAGRVVGSRSQAFHCSVGGRTCPISWEGVVRWRAAGARVLGQGKRRDLCRVR